MDKCICTCTLRPAGSFRFHSFFFVAATNLCFSEKHIYTQDVLLMVMQELTEQTPLPTLLMRTVLQSLAMWPKVIGLVLNILQRLVHKQVTLSAYCVIRSSTLHRGSLLNRFGSRRKCGRVSSSVASERSRTASTSCCNLHRRRSSDRANCLCKLNFKLLYRFKQIP